MLGQLLKLADSLDRKGLFKEADELDDLTKEFRNELYNIEDNERLFHLKGLDEMMNIINKYLVLEPEPLWIAEAKNALGPTENENDYTFSACQMNTLENIQQAGVELPDPDTNEWDDFLFVLSKVLNQKLK